MRWGIFTSIDTIDICNTDVYSVLAKEARKQKYGYKYRT